MKKISKLLVLLTFVISLVSFTVPVGAASSAYVDLGSGYSGRIDRPHDTRTGKWHGHIYKKGKQVGAENVDGTKHDGKNFKNVPKKVVDKLKKSGKWKEAKSKNDKLVKERSKLSFSNFIKWLQRNWIILNI